MRFVGGVPVGGHGGPGAARPTGTAVCWRGLADRFCRGAVLPERFDKPIAGQDDLGPPWGGKIKN